MAWKLHAIEQTQLRRKYRVDGAVGDDVRVVTRLRHRAGAASTEKIAWGTEI